MTATLDMLDRINTAVSAREAEDQAEHTGEHFDIRELGVEAMRRGFLGFTVLLTGSRKRGLPYVACFLSFAGKPVENTFSEYATPDAALAALLSQSRAK